MRAVSLFALIAGACTAREPVAPHETSERAPSEPTAEARTTFAPDYPPIAHARGWTLVRGTLPTAHGALDAIGFFNDETRAFDFIVPGRFAVVSPRGAVVVAGAPNGSWLVPGACASTAEVEPAPSRLPIAIVDGAFTADGEHLLVRDDAALYDLDGCAGAVHRQQYYEAFTSRLLVAGETAETYVLGSPGDYKIVRKSTLEPVMDRVGGPLSPRGDFVVESMQFDGAGPLELFDTRSGHTIFSTTVGALGIFPAFSSDGRSFYFADDRVHVVDLASLREQRFGGGQGTLDESRARLTTDGAYVCCDTGEQRLAIFDVETGREHQSPEGRRSLCVLDRDRAVVVDLSLSSSLTLPTEFGPLLDRSGATVALYAIDRTRAPAVSLVTFASVNTGEVLATRVVSTSVSFKALSFTPDRRRDAVRLLFDEGDGSGEHVLSIDMNTFESTGD
ncbi:MAG: hypothetical protein U0271_35940 [Polyangiaceae bacterium]